MTVSLDCILCLLVTHKPHAKSQFLQSPHKEQLSRVHMEFLERFLQPGSKIQPLIPTLNTIPFIKDIAMILTRNLSSLHVEFAPSKPRKHKAQ